MNLIDFYYFREKTEIEAISVRVVFIDLREKLRK
jgi:hypothetical protein